jgi:hypothetical protein
MLKYPFLTERKRKDFLHDLGPPNFHDKNSKLLKKNFSRPSFGNEPYSWELDHIQDSYKSPYLFVINLNTKYLYVIKVPGKKADDSLIAFTKFVSLEEHDFQHPVMNVRGDGDRGFERLKQMYPDINFHFESSKFTYHNKIVDAVIRTLRNALFEDKYWNGSHDDTIQQLVNYYNHTWHRSINMSPLEMHQDISKEWTYIRKQTEKLNDVKRSQKFNGLLNYHEGQLLAVHLEFGKTSDKFTKRRRNFDRTATFIEYQNGNAVVKLTKPVLIGGKRVYKIEMPLYFTIPITEEENHLF